MLLKAYDNKFDISIDELNSCDSVLNRALYELEDIRKNLGNFSGLENEAARLYKTIENTEQTNRNIKTLIKVLNFAEIQYASCEKNIVNNCSMVSSLDKNESRLKPIKINSPYYRLINWRQV